VIASSSPSCVVCRCSRSAPLISENGFTGYQCDECGLIFVSPRPSRQEIDEVYRRGEAFLSPEWFLGGEAVASKLRARRDVRLVRRHAGGGSLLEIGPGRGTFLAAARRSGFDVLGVELNPLQASYIRDERGIPCVESLDAAEDLGVERFDVIYHRDVLSHFYDPQAEMERLRALLVPGGLHIFETGNLADIEHRHLNLIKSFQYPDHLYFYGERSLRMLLEQTGFSHIHTYRWSVLPQLWLRSQIGRVRVRASSGGGSAGGARSDDAQGIVRPLPGGRRRAGEAAARQALDLLYHGLQLSAGRIPVGGGVPQTLLVVARKR
jgi:2-polyprenyl-3-methyl-5-hydroxy-6-metoxy-1,4-benzoquinol methylase